MLKKIRRQYTLDDSTRRFSGTKIIKFSTDDIILVQDADLEYNPNDYSKMLKPFKEKKKISVFDVGTKENQFFHIIFFKNRQSFFAFVFNYLLSAYFFL